MSQSSNQYLIFVYGTLMSGQRANYMLANADFLGKFRLPDYGMYNLGRYPGIKPLEGGCVWGEVYRVNDEALERMDEYEGNGSLYHRTAVIVTGGGRLLPVQSYVYGHEVHGFPVMAEPWGAPLSDWNEV